MVFLKFFFLTSVLQLKVILSCVHLYWYSTLKYRKHSLFQVFKFKLLDICIWHGLYLLRKTVHIHPFCYIINLFCTIQSTPYCVFVRWTSPDCPIHHVCNFRQMRCVQSTRGFMWIYSVPEKASISALFHSLTHKMPYLACLIAQILHVKPHSIRHVIISHKNIAPSLNKVIAYFVPLVI